MNSSRRNNAATSADTFLGRETLPVPGRAKIEAAGGFCRGRGGWPDGAARARRRAGSRRMRRRGFETESRRLAAGHDVLGWAVKFGRVLYQRDCFWDRVVESWRDRLPLPSSKLARTRAAGAHHHLSNVLQFGDADAAHEQALAYLTHLGRAELLERGVYPASRPELPQQLRSIGNYPLAEWLDRILNEDSTELAHLDRLLKLAV